MGEMCKANQRQNTKHKAKYQAYRSLRRREHNKAIKVLRQILRSGMKDSMAIASWESMDAPEHKSARKFFAFHGDIKVIES